MCIFVIGAKCILLIQRLLPVPEPRSQCLFLPRLGPDHYHKSININLPLHCGACKGDTHCKQQLDCINIEKILESLGFHFHCNFFGHFVVVIIELVLCAVFLYVQIVDVVGLVTMNIFLTEKCGVLIVR